MANARMISRDFFTSADLKDIPYWGQILFAGLIVYADDAGVIRDDMTFFQNTILNRNGSRKCPNQSRIRAVLELMCDRNMLQPEPLEGVSCFRVTNFTRFQRLKRREGKRREEKVSNCTRESVAQEAEELRLEGRYDPATGSLLDAIGKFARCSPAKAEAIWRKLREPKADTFTAWGHFATQHGKAAAVGAMQNYDDPREVPVEPRVDKGDPSKAEDRASAVLKARTKAVLRDATLAEKKKWDPPEQFFKEFKGKRDG